MFDKNNPEILWVNTDQTEGMGTWENPYGSVSEALRFVKPGNTIVLKQGIYRENQTIEVSGKPELPIRIVSDTDAEVIIEGACWFFYDTSDIILSGLIFKDAPFGAISVIGICKRNRFDSLRFINCGNMKKASCTLYFGGSGGEFNVVENCFFEHDKSVLSDNQTTENASIALMISDGDIEGLSPIKHHVIRRNQFTNYGFAVLIGSRDSNANPYGHIVEYNTIKNCASDGIVVKCGDTQIRGNLLEGCNGCSISVQAGVGSMIEDNRIQNSKRGISIQGFGHNITNNCIVRCHKEAISVCGKSNSENIAATNLLIENNTIIDCGHLDDSQSSFIRIEPGTTSIIQHNLFHGEGKPYQICSEVRNLKLDEDVEKNAKIESVIDDNIGSGNCTILKGIKAIQVVFKERESDCYKNESEYGAKGWMLRPEGFDVNADDPGDGKDYIEASIIEDDDGNLVIPGENFKDDIFNGYYSEILDLEDMKLEEYEE